MKRALFFFLMILIFTACHPGQGEGGLLSKKQVLTINPDADYIEMKDGAVYTHGVDWIEKKDYIKGERVGIVEEGMANHLPVGAELYTTKEPSGVLIAEYSGNTKRYLVAMGE
ncbi:hypothetical protein [Halobacillus sp. H74]|uniref:hypothetical protein n=1 Tax=Halobacillus sp. H74 TaxID=3457436 RepID=UPI003FCCF3E3